MAVATAYVAFGIYLLAVGGLETIVTPGAGTATVRDPTSAGLVPLATGALVLYGIWSGRDRIAWAGGAVALISGAAFLFSLSGVLIPLAMLLVAALALRWELARRATS
jgi:hypothetical protein